MACNQETSADSSKPTPPSPATTGAHPGSDVLAPCCNNREHLLKEGSLFNVSKQKADLPAEPATASVPSMGVLGADVVRSNFPPTVALKKTSAMADMSDLHTVFKSKSSSSWRKIRVNASVNTAFDDMVDSHVRSPNVEYQRIPSPLYLSPLQLPPQQGVIASSDAVNRCMACRKRVGLLAFKCRCGDLFCALHRYSDKHDCSFDYKAAGRLAIAKENPVVKASKIDKI